MIIRKIYLLFVVLLFSSCSKEHPNDNPKDSSNLETVTYQENLEDFPNPERGFFRTAFVHTSNFTPLNKTILEGYRGGQIISGTQYAVSASLVQRVYIMDNYKTGSLPEDFLEKIKTDLNVAREAGIKLILRFSYTDETHSGGCPEGSICPPYGDVPKSVILNHISQLKPILQNNADVIACVQEGFIGIWGENYYTDYFGDASGNGAGKYSDQNWKDRNEVLKALLDAVPKDRMVQVRYPQLKQRYIYGVSASIKSAPMTEEEAFDESDKARIGYHNDAFLNDPGSQGFVDMGNSSTPKRSDEEVVSILEDYQKKESQYVVVGGETNAINSPMTLCGPTGSAEQELRDYHYSFLNAEYYRDVLNSWYAGGCFDGIRRKLGYRFLLDSVQYQKEVQAGSTFKIKMFFYNSGYTAPFNERPVQLLLRNQQTSEITTLNFDTDIRKWFSGVFNLDEELKIPENIAAGTYEVLLNLPDKYASIANRPEYSIRLAEKGVWEDSTGYNDLKFSINIK